MQVLEPFSDEAEGGAAADLLLEKFAAFICTKSFTADEVDAVAICCAWLMGVHWLSIQHRKRWNSA